MKKEYRVVSWQRIEADCLSLAQKLPRHITFIMPVARGGLVPGAIISYALDRPILGIVTNGNTFMTSDRKDIAVVDDVCDTGQTFMEIKKRFPNACYAAVYTKPKGFEHCDHCMIQVPQSTWLVFPWARADAINR